MDFSESYRLMLQQLKLSTGASFQPRLFAQSFSEYLTRRNEVYQQRLMDAVNAIAAIEDSDTLAISANDDTDIYVDNSILMAPDGSCFTIGQILQSVRDFKSDPAKTHLDHSTQLLFPGQDGNQWTVDDLLDNATDSIMNAAAMSTVLSQLQASVDLIPTVSAGDIAARLQSQFGGRTISLSSFPGLWETAANPELGLEDKIRSIAALYASMAEATFVSATEQQPAKLEWPDQVLSVCSGASPILAAFTLAADVVEEDGIFAAVKAVFNMIKGIFNNVLKPLFDGLIAGVKGMFSHEAISVDKSAPNKSWVYPVVREVAPDTNVSEHLEVWNQIVAPTSGSTASARLYNSIPRNDGELAEGSVYQYPLRFPLNMGDIYAWREGDDAQYASGYGFSHEYRVSATYRFPDGSTVDRDFTGGSSLSRVLPGSIMQNDDDIYSDMSRWCPEKYTAVIPSVPAWYQWSQSDGIDDSLIFLCNTHDYGPPPDNDAVYERDFSITVAEGVDWLPEDVILHRARSTQPYAGANHEIILKAIIFEGYPSRIRFVELVKGKRVITTYELSTDQSEKLHKGLYEPGYTVRLHASTFGIRNPDGTFRSLPQSFFSEPMFSLKYCHHSVHEVVDDQCLSLPTSAWVEDTLEALMPDNARIRYRIYVRPQHIGDAYGRQVDLHRAITAWGTEWSEDRYYNDPGEVMGGLFYSDPDDDNPLDICQATRDSLNALIAYAFARDAVLTGMSGQPFTHKLAYQYVSNGITVDVMPRTTACTNGDQILNSMVVEDLHLNSSTGCTYSHFFNDVHPLITQAIDTMVVDFLFNAQILTAENLSNVILPIEALDALFIPAIPSDTPSHMKYAVVSDAANAAKGAAAIAAVATAIIGVTVKVAKVKRKKKIKAKLAKRESDLRLATKQADRTLHNPKATADEKKQALKMINTAERKRDKLRNKAARLGIFDSPRTESIGDVLQRLNAGDQTTLEQEMDTTDLLQRLA